MILESCRIMIPKNQNLGEVRVWKHESKSLGEARVWMSRWGGGMKILIKKSRWGEGMIDLGEVRVWFLGEVRVWSLGEPRWALFWHAHVTLGKQNEKTASMFLFTCMAAFRSSVSLLRSFEALILTVMAWLISLMASSCCLFT